MKQDVNASDSDLELSSIDTEEEQRQVEEYFDEAREVIYADSGEDNYLPR